MRFLWTPAHGGITGCFSSPSESSTVLTRPSQGGCVNYKLTDRSLILRYKNCLVLFYKCCPSTTLVLVGFELNRSWLQMGPTSLCFYGPQFLSSILKTSVFSSPCCQMASSCKSAHPSHKEKKPNRRSQTRLQFPIHSLYFLIG